MPYTLAASHDAEVEFGRRVRARREALFLTRTQVAQAMGTALSYVGLIERGERSPSFGTLLALGRALRLDPGVLVRGLQHYGDD